MLLPLLTTAMKRWYLLSWFNGFLKDSENKTNTCWLVSFGPNEQRLSMSPQRKLQLGNHRIPTYGHLNITHSDMHPQQKQSDQRALLSCPSPSDSICLQKKYCHIPIYYTVLLNKNYHQSFSQTSHRREAIHSFDNWKTGQLLHQRCSLPSWRGTFSAFCSRTSTEWMTSAVLVASWHCLRGTSEIYRFHGTMTPPRTERVCLNCRPQPQTQEAILLKSDKTPSYKLNQ